MKITIESTNEIVALAYGLNARLWNGITEKGVECVVIVPVLGVKRTDDATQFEEELKELPIPMVQTVLA